MYQEGRPYRASSSPYRCSRRSVCNCAIHGRRQRGSLLVHDNGGGLVRHVCCRLPDECKQRAARECPLEWERACELVGSEVLIRQNECWVHVCNARRSECPAVPLRPPSLGSRRGTDGGGNVDIATRFLTQLTAMNMAVSRLPSSRYLLHVYVKAI